MRKRAAIYCRVVAGEQSTDARSFLKLQHEACIRFCQQHEIAVARSLFEVAAGSENEHRPKLAELRQMVCAAQVEVVVVYNVGRLSHCMEALVTLFREAQEQKVDIYSLFALLPTDGITPLYAQAMTCERERIARIFSHIGLEAPISE